MGVDSAAHILEEFDNKYELYETYTKKLHELITELLRLEGLSVVSVTYRPKERDKLERKIKKANGKYTCLGDVTDVAGIRIITYFAEDVDRVAEVIESEFDIDQNNSVDKREIMKSNQFGYLSLHYVISLPSHRTDLTEYRRFTGLKAEVQIRSILQHAWAEIEHDFGYKTELEIPQKIRRRFTRIAGLLEIADTEFDNIRKELDKYEKEIRNRIFEDPGEVLIDRLTLESYLKESKLVKEINKEISKHTGLGQFPDTDFTELRNLLVELHYLDIDTISELDNKLKDNKELVVQWAVKWLMPSSEEEERGYYAFEASIFYLDYVLISKTGSFDEVLSFIKIARRTTINKEEMAKNLLDTYNLLTK